MKPGEMLYFTIDAAPYRAQVKCVLFHGASTAERNGDPWRELTVVQTEGGSYVVRQRVRQRERNGDHERTFSLGMPEWSVHDSIAAAVRTLAASDPLEIRALRELAPLADAIEV